MKKKFSVSGMSCSACSSGIERTIKKLDGVESVEVSLMGECMSVEFNKEKITEADIIQAVINLGYGAEIFDETIQKKTQVQPEKIKYRFIVSILLLLPLMYLSMGGMLGLPQPKLLMNYCLQAILSGIILVVNAKFFINGGKALLKGMPNMDTLVAMGSAVSYVYSFVLTILAFFGHHNHHGAHLFFESAAMILTLVTLGKWLEERSKKKTGDEVEKIIALMPNTVTVIRFEKEQVVNFSELTVGDILVVKQGDYIPVDGKIVEGCAFIDRAAITGESLPIEVQIGDFVTGADILKSGYIKVKAERVGAQTTLSQIVRMVKEAGGSKAPIQKIADKIAGIFVPVVTALAVLTFLVWFIISKDVSVAINYSISVLVISCPCSLGLATPVAILAATGRGMSLGVLFKNAETLQKAKKIDCVLLDKTATLTQGIPSVTDVEAVGESTEQILKIAAGIEAHSNHPIASCIKAYADERIDEALKVNEYHYEIGKGAVAKIDNETYYLGNRKLLPNELLELSLKYERSYENKGKTVVYLATSEKLLGVFAVADTLKESSGMAVQKLKERELRVEMITGDAENVARSISNAVGLDGYIAETLPQDKFKVVEERRKEGNFVAMVGDGINDSPALKAADVGIAMGTGTDIAIDSADVVIVGGDLRLLSTIIDLSKATVRNIKQNLFWAFFYNCVAIPVAGGAFAWCGVVLNPMIAAACMSLSSLFVVSNALRLMAFQRKNNKDRKEIINMKKTLKIEGMMCQHCVAHVKKALETVEGVSDVQVDLKKKTATLVLEKEITNQTFMDVIEQAGYSVKKIID